MRNEGEEGAVEEFKRKYINGYCACWGFDVKLWNCYALAALLWTFTVPAMAQIAVPGDYDAMIKHHGEVTALGNDGFGDRIDIATGALEIVQTDVDLVGNSALPVRISRRFTAGNRYALGHFGQWNLDLPNLHGVFSTYSGFGNPVGWTVDEFGADAYMRCAKMNRPPIIIKTTFFDPDDYWQGSHFHLPGSGDEEVLYGGLTRTKSGAKSRCVPLAATSSGQGDGFEMITPDGTIYTLNQMVSRYVSNVSKDGQSISRAEVILYPTLVTDRFGNTVTYVWSPANPWQLLSITASDGRHITLHYPDSSTRQVDSISDGTRTWFYSGPSTAYTVLRPDGSKWVSNLDALFSASVGASGDGGCLSGDPADSTTTTTGTVASPSGATATFTLKKIRLGRSWVVRECPGEVGSQHAMDARNYYALGVSAKVVRGPELPAAGLSWAYSYQFVSGCWSTPGYMESCTMVSPTTRTVTVTEPQGGPVRYTFGTKFGDNEGLLLKRESGWSGSSYQRTVETAYADADAAPYGGVNSGNSFRTRGDWYTAGKKHPQRKIVTTQQGRTFTWEVAAGCNGHPYCFDEFARPTKVMKTSTP